ncbi:uncharacterized protein EHS24_006431 [Apiotrichum porosum]|uniref:Uncharacterized protein n=1 Tax=Apiotrichum porosum TaxID=105984 RepID=A0A427Y1I4_9TREE|nr:uncharacterized protein EHS24_006431 [Apiotrichum porosum]RSH84893.1 hypothetical protein EHS24_006431 [Apiotrichum porosum]
MTSKILIVFVMATLATSVPVSTPATSDTPTTLASNFWERLTATPTAKVTATPIKNKAMAPAATVIVTFIRILPYLLGIGIPVLICAYIVWYIYACFEGIRKLNGDAREARLARYRRYWPTEKWYPFNLGPQTVWVAAHEQPSGAVIEPNLAAVPCAPAAARIVHHPHTYTYTYTPPSLSTFSESPPPYVSQTVTTPAAAAPRHPPCPFADRNACPACR